MNRRIRREVNNEDFTAVRIWKENPPGAEQKELDKLFSNNIIDESDSPNDVRKKYPMFMAFSPKIFAVHFRKTKAKHGLFASSSRTSTPELLIPEIGGANAITEDSSSSRNINCDTDSSLINELNQCYNFPTMTWSYTDHIKKNKQVYVAFPMIGGSKDVKFVISEDGMQVVIEFLWPTAIFKPSELFSDEIEGLDCNNIITMDHPKLHSFASHLIEMGITDNSKPKGKMIVKLPFQVQREIGTWVKKAVQKPNGTRILLIQLTAYQENLIIQDADTAIHFD